MLVDVLPRYLLHLHACDRYLLYILPKNYRVDRHVGEAACPSGSMGVTQSRDWKATGRYEAGNQCLFPISNPSWKRTGMEKRASESSPEVPGVIPAGTQWPAQRWPSNTGWVVTLFLVQLT